MRRCPGPQGAKGDEALTIQISILALVALFAWVGAVRLARPVSDLYVAGRLVPAVLNGMAIAASFIAVLVFAALAGAIGTGWAASIPLVLGAAVGLIAPGLWLVPALRKFGGFTVSDFLGDRFGRQTIGPLAVTGVILCSFPALALTLYALGLIAAKVFALDLDAGIAAAAAALLLCTAWGGMRSASLTQVAQYVVTAAVGLAALLFLLWARNGNLLDVETGLDEALGALDLDALAAPNLLNRAALAFCLAAGIASLPHLLMRGLTTPTAGEARLSFLLAVPFTAALCLAALLYGPLLQPASELSSAVLPGMLALGAVAALLAAGTGLAVAIANTLSHDAYFTLLHPRATTGQRVLVGRAAIVLVTAVAAMAGFAAPNILPGLAAAAFSLAASALLPALVLGIWWERATGEGALAGMLVGLGVCLYYLLAPFYVPFAFYETSSFVSAATPDQAARYEALLQSYYLAEPVAKEAALKAWEEVARDVANWWGVKPAFAALFAVPLGFLTTIGVSLFTPAPSRDVQNFVRDLRCPAT